MWPIEADREDHAVELVSKAECPRQLGKLPNDQVSYLITVPRGRLWPISGYETQR